jgi:DNA repair protein SbcC/Rad50
MRPVALTIEGLRSFRTPVEISFQGREHLAIIGDTGAGKSSILDAMTYALFGRPAWAGKANQEIMNDLSDHMRVTLRFVVGGRTFEVTRVLRRSGDRLVGAARASLIEFSGDGTEIRRIEQVRQVNDEIKEAIGLDADAFLRTVVLPQGQFAQLLVGDDPADRARVLRQVWRTDELTRAGQLIDEVLPDVSQLAGQVTQALEGAPEDPQSHLDQLRADSQLLRNRASQAHHAQDAAAVARDALVAASKTVETAEDAAQNLAQFDFSAEISAAQAIMTAAAKIATERKTAERGQSSLRDELRAVPPDDDGLDLQEIGAARTTLDELPSRAQTAVDVASHARREAAEAESARRQVGELQEGLQNLAAQLQQREQPRQDLDSVLARAHDNLSSAQAALDAALQAILDAETSTARAVEKATEADGMTQEAASTRQGELPRVQLRVQAAEKHYADAQRHNAAGAAAHDLHPGDNCSVCNRPLPLGWRAPIASDIDTARTAYRLAERELADVQGKIRDCDTKAEVTKNQTREIQRDAEQSWRDARTAAGVVAKLLDRDQIDLASITPDSQLLQPLSIALATAEDELSAYDSETQRLREQRAAADSRLAAAHDRLVKGDGARARASDEAALAVQSLRDHVKSLPAELQIEVSLPDDPLQIETVTLLGLEHAHQILNDRNQELDRRADRRRQFQQELDSVADQIRDLDDRSARLVLTPGNQLIERLNLHRDAVRTATILLTMPEIELPPAASLALPSSLVATVNEIRDCTYAAVRWAKEMIKTAQRDAAVRRAQLTQMAAAFGIPVSGQDEVDAGEVVERARENATEAEVEARAAERSARDFSLVVGPLIRLRRTADELLRTHRALKDLSVALKPGAFPKWLTLRRSRALLVHASRLLEQMTTGRYAFAELDDDTGEWRVVDNDSGLPRTPASLSGGEQFIASLALALGLVEMMARSGGQLESLWLDEGFGSLDRSNLDAAIEALASVAARGRMVAVISHVLAVAEQVGDVLAVTRDVTGSKARWLDSNERTQVATGELEAESAFSGLLD